MPLARLWPMPSTSSTKGGGWRPLLLACQLIRAARTVKADGRPAKVYILTRPSPMSPGSSRSSSPTKLGSLLPLNLRPAHGAAGLSRAAAAEGRGCRLNSADLASSANRLASGSDSTASLKATKDAGVWQVNRRDLAAYISRQAVTPDGQESIAVTAGALPRLHTLEEVSAQSSYSSRTSGSDILLVGGLIARFHRLIPTN